MRRKTYSATKQTNHSCCSLHHHNAQLHFCRGSHQAMVKAMADSTWLYYTYGMDYTQYKPAFKHIQRKFGEGTFLQLKESQYLRPKSIFLDIKCQPKSGSAQGLFLISSQ